MVCDGLRRCVAAHHKKGKLIAAICAAPMILGASGILEGKNVTCYPGFEDKLNGANCKNSLVEVDGNIITAKGPGVSMEFAFTIASRFVSEEKLARMRYDMILEK